MTLTWSPFDLKLRYPFRIAGFSRASTPIMLVKLMYGEHSGLGEASMVPYMGESFETATSFLSCVDFKWLTHPFDYGKVIQYLDSLAPGNPAVKAAIDIALHDLDGKLRNKPCFSMFGSNPQEMPLTSITIGMDTPDVVARKVAEADGAGVLKVKLGSPEDRTLIETVRTITSKPLYVDANQGWSDKEAALDMILWLSENGVQLVEQPMLKTDQAGNAWISERSPIPIIADESIQRFADLEKVKDTYHGINVKLMKSAGMHEAYLMIKQAKAFGLKVLIGCMSETSVATLAAAALAPLCDWADIDGPFLTANNPFAVPDFADGKWILSEMPGLGVEEL